MSIRESSGAETVTTPEMISSVFCGWNEAASLIASLTLTLVLVIGAAAAGPPRAVEISEGIS